MRNFCLPHICCVASSSLWADFNVAQWHGRNVAFSLCCRHVVLFVLLRGREGVVSLKVSRFVVGGEQPWKVSVPLWVSICLAVSTVLRAISKRYKV